MKKTRSRKSCDTVSLNIVAWNEKEQQINEIFEMLSSGYSALVPALVISTEILEKK
jgi:hypothetical protein